MLKTLHFLRHEDLPDTCLDNYVAIQTNLRHLRKSFSILIPAIYNLEIATFHSSDDTGESIEDLITIIL